MREFTNTEVINYNWGSEVDAEITPEIQNQLEGHATDRIAECRGQGYTSGELYNTINDIEFSGWWDFNR